MTVARWQLTECRSCWCKLFLSGTITRHCLTRHTTLSPLTPPPLCWGWRKTPWGSWSRCLHEIGNYDGWSGDTGVTATRQQAAACSSLASLQHTAAAVLLALQSSNQLLTCSQQKGKHFLCSASGRLDPWRSLVATSVQVRELPRPRSCRPAVPSTDCSTGWGDSGQ